MSDALLTQISKQLGDIHATLKGGGGAVAPKTPASQAGGAPEKTAASAADIAAAKAAAAKKADVAKKADAAAKTSAATATKPAGPAAGTKAPGGKHTIEQVRELIRKVAADKNLGKQSAKDILADDGGGVEKVLDLKPENYDKVYEACEVLLNGEGNKEPEAAAEEDDLM